MREADTAAAHVMDDAPLVDLLDRGNDLDLVVRVPKPGLPEITILKVLPALRRTDHLPQRPGATATAPDLSPRTASRRRRPRQDHSPPRYPARPKSAQVCPIVPSAVYAANAVDDMLMNECSTRRWGICPRSRSRISRRIRALTRVLADTSICSRLVYQARAAAFVARTQRGSRRRACKWRPYRQGRPRLGGRGVKQTTRPSCCASRILACHAPFL